MEPPAGPYQGGSQMPFALRRKGRFWYARGTVPIRKTDGTIGKARVEEPTREESKTRATRVANDLWNYYQEQAYRPKQHTASFLDAVVTYVETKHCSKGDRQFFKKLIAHFGELPISAIDQKAITDACTKLYPEAKASTLHRAVYAPVIAVLRFHGIQTKFEKPKIQKVPLTIPDDEWFEKLLPHCEPRLQAFILFLSLTGLRVSEALRAIDNGDGTATVARTKTGASRTVPLYKVVSDLASKWEPDGRTTKALFWFGSKSNVYRSLKDACKKAGVPYYGTHALGRHTFATRLLRQGYTTKFVAEAGAWANTRMVDTIYGHLEKDPVQQEAWKVGEEWINKIL